MGYKQLSTISDMESDEVIKSSVKSLVQIPREYEVTFDDESECDVPLRMNLLQFLQLSQLLFSIVTMISLLVRSLSNEDVPMENFKIYSNSLFDDEKINSDKIDPHYFNAESDLIKYLSNQDTLFDSSPKFDYLEEFSGELMPTRIINEEHIKKEHEEYISLMEKLLTIKFISTEEIDILTGMDDLMPPGIESNDDDSEGDIYFLEELLSNDSISLPENESSNFDHHDDPSFPRPLPKPPDVEVFFDFEPNSRDLISTVMNNIDELNEDECFDPGGGKCLKTLVFGVFSRFTRALHPLLAISLGKSNILDHYRLTFICFLYA
nr:hypothetical protein [Tanacetum cinerariifolium]